MSVQQVGGVSAVTVDQRGDGSLVGDKAMDSLIEIFQNRLHIESVSSSLYACASCARGYSFIDTPYILMLRAINAVAKVISSPLFSSDTLLTRKQKERIEDTERMRSQLAAKQVSLKFCEITGRYIDELIPAIVAEKLSIVPSKAEKLGYYNIGIRVPYGLGYLIRYVNYQVDLRTGYRAAVIDSIFGRTFHRIYCGLRAYIAQRVLDKSITSLWGDSEHLLLSLCSKIDTIEKANALGDSKKVSKGALETPKKVAIVLESLACALSQSSEVEAYIKETGADQDSHDAFIARLAWHQKKRTLPPGVPDPSKEPLTRKNLPEKLDEALYSYLSELSDRLLSAHVPPRMKKGFFGFLYWLEGKEFLKEIMTYGSVEFGLKQLIDPDFFTLIVLTSVGLETMELEPDKFGRNTRAPIFKTAQRMVIEVLKRTVDADAILKIFGDSRLAEAPGSLDAILQRTEAKALLKTFISRAIHEAIKGNSPDSKDSGLKAIRKSASQVPVFGLAAQSLDLLIRGTVLSLQYVSGGARGRESFFVWMAKNITGTNLCDYLAERIIALIYHPSWRITLLHLLDGMVSSLGVAEHAVDVSEEEVFENFSKVTSFLFEHVTGDGFMGNVGEWANYFTGDQAFEAFREAVQPSGDSMLDKGLPVLLPAVKEYILYGRVADFFRRQTIGFDGDTKFWECFVREYLNQIVASSMAEEVFDAFSQAQAQVRAKIRQKVVDDFVELEILSNVVFPKKIAP